MFIIRNFKYAAQNVRKLYSVRKSMKLHKKRNHTCAFCGADKNLQTHHNLPVSFAPELAGDHNNMTTLCSRCHLIVGHLRNWKHYNSSLAETCKARTLVTSAERWPF
jgi:5-methylcytosine-specific restriction endonuclease McrA